jgi:integrase/recombinase XerD
MYEEYCAKKMRNLKAKLENPKLTKQMRKELSDFSDEYSAARKLSVPAQESYVRSLSFFGEFLADRQLTSYKEATAEDIKTYLKDPYPRNGREKSDSILTWLKSSLKVFYRYLLTGKLGKKDECPPLVDWISVGVAKGRDITDKALISPEEFTKMLDATQNTRDRAFLYMLYETGCRLGELLDLKLEDVHFDSDKSYFDVTRSKTQERRIFIFDCVRDLLAWMNQHPQKNDPEAYLFVNLKKGKKRKWGESRWDYDGALRIVQRVAKRAGIKKRVWVHLFRHTAATNDARRSLPPDLARLKYGWGKNSRMFERYTHRNTDDLMKWEQQTRGMDKDKIVDPHAPRQCPRCNKLNDWTAAFCECGHALNAKVINEQEEFRKNIYEFMRRSEERQQKIDERLKALEQGA